MRIFSRLQNLLRGMMAQWLGHREQRNPEAVYEAAIQARSKQYSTLREAAAGVLYMRSKLSKELESKAAELERLRPHLDQAVDRDDDDDALALIARRQILDAEVKRLTAELTDLHGEAETAKRNLIAFQNEIARLRDEKVRMAARLANARARLRLQETLNGLSPDADIQALEAVREHINQLVAQVQIGREVADTDLEQRLSSIRDAEAKAAARAQLEELKRGRKRKLLPLVVPQARTAT